MKIKGVCLLFLSAFLLVNVVYSQTDSLVKKASANSLSDVREGERIFHGLAPTSGKPVNCASCHNTNHIDTLNWNPSAIDLAMKYSRKDIVAFKTAIMQPAGKVMTQLHENLKLSDDQIIQLKEYLDSLAKRGIEPQKPLLTNRLIFILLLVLFILAFVDFAITRKIKRRYIHIVVLFTTLIFMTKYVAHAAIDIGRSKNYQPDQPIKFSHRVHAGQNQTSCLYCHFNAERSKFAGIPPASVCMNCHVLVKEGSRSGKFEINKIYQAMDENRPIKWVKVHNLPDHVFFSHAQHVVAGKVDCLKCHGDVAKMDQIIQVNDLSMGWCVKCHRETGIQLDNKFYGKYEQLHKDIKAGKIKNATVDKIGGTDCMKCHY